MLSEQAVKSCACWERTKECPQPILLHSFGHATKHHHIQRCRARALTECFIGEEEVRVSRLALDQNMSCTRPGRDPEIEAVPSAARRLLFLLHQAPLRVPRVAVKVHRAAEEVVLPGQAAVKLDWPVVCIDSIHIEGHVFGVHGYVGWVTDRGVEGSVGEAWYRRQ